MAVTKKNTYVIGSNNDLTNALAMIDLNRLGVDTTQLLDDAGTVKVAIGSLIEANGSVYQVESAAETPSGTPTEGAYLYFNDVTPRFEWSTDVPVFSAVLDGWYNGGRRLCRWQYFWVGTDGNPVFDRLETKGPVLGNLMRRYGRVDLTAEQTGAAEVASAAFVFSKITDTKWAACNIGANNLAEYDWNPATKTITKQASFATTGNARFAARFSADGRDICVWNTATQFQNYRLTGSTWAAQGNLSTIALGAGTVGGLAALRYGSRVIFFENAGDQFDIVNYDGSDWTAGDQRTESGTIYRLAEWKQDGFLALEVQNQLFRLYEYNGSTIDPVAELNAADLGAQSFDAQSLIKVDYRTWLLSAPFGATPANERIFLRYDGKSLSIATSQAPSDGFFGTGLTAVYPLAEGEYIITDTTDDEWLHGISTPRYELAAFTPR